MLAFFFLECLCLKTMTYFSPKSGRQRKIPPTEEQIANQLQCCKKQNKTHHYHKKIYLFSNKVTENKSSDPVNMNFN